MRKKVFFRMLLCCIGVFSLFTSYAQTKTVTGTVSDEKGQPLTGATVTVKDTKIAATTDAGGKFSIQVPPSGKSLIVSFVGMEDRQLSIENRTSLTVSLKQSNSVLGDVVVIGYGSQRRGDVNGAISSVAAREIADIPQPSVDQMLQGRVSGVTVTQNSGAPGAAVSVRVRGITSFSGSEPIYVIDGVVIDGNASQQASTNGGLINASPTPQETSFSALASINPNDIETIDVLKDASATSIYGSRAANGVVIITTKKGKAGQGKINYDGWYGRQRQGKYLDMMNLPQFAAYENNLADLFGLTRRVEFTNPGKLGPGTNWQRAIFSDAPEYSNTLSMSGASDKTDYYISAGYFNQSGTIASSNFRRYSFHAAVNSQVKEWFKVGTSLSADQNKTSSSLGNNYGLIYNALLEAPDAPVYNADGTFAGPVVINGTVQGTANPIAQAALLTNNLTRTNVQGNIHGDIKFLKDFTLHSEVDGNFDWTQSHLFYPTFSYGAAGSAPAYFNTQASLLFNNDYDNYWNWDETLNYTHTFGDKHAVNAIAGHEVWESTYDGVNAQTSGFIGGNTVQTLNLGTQTTNLLDEPKGSQSMESYFARIIYTYDNKYSLTGNFRRDRSSNFAQGHQVGNFPGIAVSWKLSEEPFLKSIQSVFSNLKVRVGYGTVGNASIGQYKYGSAIAAAATGLGTAFLFSNLNNPNLKWETAIQQNVGLDFSMLNDRIDGSFDVYKKTSKDFLFQQPLPAFLVGGVAEYSGNSVVQPPWVNAGQVQNTGFEFTIHSRNIVKKDFSWSSSIIFSHYTNKVVSLNGFPVLNGIISTGFGPTIFATRTAPGGPIGEFYGYKTMGIIKTQAQLTDLAAHPQNVLGNPQPITSDRTIGNGIYLGDILYAGADGKGGPNKQYNLGSPNPSFTYSIGNNFTYKDFDLSIFLVGSQGGKILNAVHFQTEGEYGLYMNQLASVANYWTPSNPNSNIPTPRGSFGNNNLVMSDRFLEDASYLRIQNVKLGYTLPARISRVVKMSHLRAFISGQNLYVFTKYTGLDPEVGSMNQNPILQNIDYGRYPTPRSITFGLNADF
ncbi:MAG TPA: TonB-dependent receptor [Puia sp.]|jgi:TonB-linked SusC/RagA family outer membrane protein